MANRYKFLINKRPKRPRIDTRPSCYGYHDGDVFFFYDSKGKRRYAKLIRRKNDWWIGGRTSGTALMIPDRTTSNELHNFELRYLPIKRNVWFHKLMEKILWNERKNHFASNPDAKP
jgi:hypothetical protein